MIGLGNKPLIIGERRANPLGSLTAGQLSQADARYGQLATTDTWALLQTFTTGITFGQTTLNYYETGTFTPGYLDNGGGTFTITYANLQGTYQRIGTRVNVSINIETTAVALVGGGGALLLGALPFAALAGSFRGGVAVGRQGIVGLAGGYLSEGSSSTYMLLVKSDASLVTSADLVTAVNSKITVSFSYEVA